MLAIALTRRVPLAALAFCLLTGCLAWHSSRAAFARPADSDASVRVALVDASPPVALEGGAAPVAAPMPVAAVAEAPWSSLASAEGLRASEPLTTPTPIATSLPPVDTPIPTSLPPVETPIPTSVPPVVTPVVGLMCVCASVQRQVPAAYLNNALANPGKIYGWQQPLNPNKPTSRMNPLKSCLSLRNPSIRFNAMWNSVVWKVGCP